MKERQKKKIVSQGAYLLVKGRIKPQDDDRMFQILDKLFEINQQEKEEETFDSIKEKIFSKIKGGQS